MKKGKLIGKIFGIALVLVVVVSMFGGLPSISNSISGTNGVYAESSYDWQTATNYATTYAYTACGCGKYYGSSPPPQGSGIQLTPSGGDCAHFVSHCLAAGGVSNKGTTYARGWCEGGAHDYVITVSEMRSWFADTGIATKVSSVNQLEPGDVIVTYDYGHVVLYIGTYGGKAHQVASHSTWGTFSYTYWGTPNEYWHITAGTPSPARFNIGDTVEVYNCPTSSVGLKVRDAPAGNPTGVPNKYDGDMGTVLDGPQTAILGGTTYTWWEIRWEDGPEGWSAEGDATEYWLREKYVPPSTRFSINDQVEVFNVDPIGLSVRTVPPGLEFIQKVYDGTTGTVKDGPFYGVPKGSSGFYHFWKVDFGSTVGWVAEGDATEDWLKKVTPCPYSCWDRSPLSGNELAALVRSHFPLGGVPQTGESKRVTAYAVAKAESGGNPSACGDNDRSIGLWQINIDAHSTYDKCLLFEEDYNANAAVEISSNGADWNPWCTWEKSACGGNGNEAYKQYLTEARKHFYPKVTSLSVSSTSISLGQTVEIYYSVSDDVGLDRVELWRAVDVNGDGQPDWPSNPQDTKPASGQSVSGSFEDSGHSSADTYWYGIHVVDNSGAPEAWNDERNSRTGGSPGVFGPIQVEVIPANSPPQLSNGYVDPPNGDTSTDFYYYVTYFDPDGDSPSVRQVTIDGIAYTMNPYLYENSHIIYRYGPKNLSTGGTHYYFFYFEDGKGGWDRLPSGVDMYLGPSVTPETYPPQVTTEGASSITTSSATLTGNLDSTGGLDCQVWFEYGTTISYGSSTLKLPMSSTGPFSAVISSLNSDTTYHFRACAQNSKGTHYGSDMTFATASEQVVTFPDPNLEAAIREAIGKPTGDICQSDLSGLISLDADNRNIVNLAGLEHCTSLIYLDLAVNQIHDLDPIYGLTNLEELDLFENNVTDISSLSSLINLEELVLKGNQITGIASLSELTNLRYLSLASNQISDITPLSSLTHLKELNIELNQISDITPLSALTNLRELSLENNQITDIVSLSELINLKQLDLCGNQISDIGPVSGFTNLETLWLGSNDISNIGSLSGLSSLERLYLRDNRISYINQLSGLTNLEVLDLSGNPINDISPLFGLNNLTRVFLQDNQITDITPLSGLTSLQELFLTGNEIADINPLSGLRKLELLSLCRNEISDISPLGNLVSLEFLDLVSNHISDISPLSNLTGLTNLSLRSNQISDIEPLVANSGLVEGDTVDLRNNPLSTDSLSIYIPQLEARGVTVYYDAPSIRTWYVDDDLADYLAADFTEIQDAVDAANPGDTIIVYPGTYTENVDINKDHLTIQSESGAEMTIVQAANPDDHVFEVTADYVNISGFTVTGVMTSDSYAYPGGIYLYYANQCNISNNDISNNMYKIYTYGISLRSSSNNMLYNNRCRNFWHGIDLGGSSNNILSSNAVLDNYAGIELDGSSNNVFINNLILNNYDGIEMLWYSTSNTIVNNNVLGCHRIDFQYYSSNNEIYLNNLVNVPIVNSYESVNFWNSVEEITYTYEGETYTSHLGNYWSDYEEKYPEANEIDSTGIWNIGYSVNSDKDNYPLTRPFESHYEYYGYPIALVAPSNGDSNAPVTEIVFAWTSVLGATSYDFSLSANLNDLWTDAAVTNEMGLTAIAYTYTGTLDYATSYYWQVRAMKDTDLLVSGMSTFITHTPQTVYVDDDFTDDPRNRRWNTIQKGITDAEGGDTVIVYEGTYQENVVVDKPIILRGDGMPIIDGGDNEVGIGITPTANGCTIEGFSLTGGGEHGCWIDVYSDYNTIQSNVCSGGIGLSLTADGMGAGSIGSKIIGNELGRGMFLFGEPDQPIEVFSSHTVENNTINGKPIYYYSNTEGITVPKDAGQILVANCSDMVIEGIQCTHAVVGIELAYVTDSIVRENNCSDCDGAGIALFFSSSNTLTDNEVEGSANGIYLMFSDDNLLEGNVLTGGTVENDQCGGICLFAANSGNVIRDNISSNNKGCGVCLRWSGNSNNIVVGNTISNNKYGIYLGCQDANTIYLNGFLDNAFSAHCYSSTNIWHSPEEITYTYNGKTYTSYLGNYWSDYTGNDADGDGVGDTPHNIVHDSVKDNYPLVAPFANYVIGPAPYPVITSSLEITPEKDEYYVGDTVTATFTIRNTGDVPVTLSTLTVGGRDPDGLVVDFEWKNDITLDPNEEYIYIGQIILPYRVGDYHFFCAYQRPDGTWNTSLDLGEGLTDSDRVEDITVSSKYYLVGIPHKGRGGIVVPKEVFPEGKGEIIPIYVPSVVDGSNAMFGNGDWQTIEEIEKTRFDFDWMEFFASFNVPGPPENEYINAPKLAVFSLISETFISAVQASSLTTLKITIQKNSEGDLRAILQIADVDANTSMRSMAGKGWNVLDIIQPPAAHWKIVSKPIYEAFHLEPTFYYTIGLRVDEEHRNDEYIGYLSFTQDNNLTYTPKLYSQDAFKVALREPYMPEKEIFSVCGDGYLSLFERSLTGEMATRISKILASVSVLIVSEPGMLIDANSPVELRVYDSQDRVTGLINGLVKEEIPESIYNEQNETVTIFSPNDTYTYEVQGTDEDTYGLDITYIETGEVITFAGIDIPTAPGAVHQYTIDWEGLSEGEEGVTIQIDSDGDGEFEDTFTSDGELTQDEFLVEVLVPVVPPRGGGGGGCPATRYLTVDWDENITEKPLYSNDRLVQDLLGPSPDGSHSLLLERGTHAPVVDGKTHNLIVIRELEEIPPLPENTEAIVAFEITPTGAVFDRDIFLTLSLDQSQLPENAVEVTMAYYDDVNGVWTPLDSEPVDFDGVAEISLSAPINHFSIFGVLAELAPTPPPQPAHFVANGLNIEPTVEKISAFVTKTGESVGITANVANDGGQEGTYIVELKLNGETVDTEIVTLGAGQSQQVSFTVPGLDYGQYEVEVAGLSGEFTTSRTITWWLIIVIIVAIGLVIWGVVWGKRRRRITAQEG